MEKIASVDKANLKLFSPKFSFLCAKDFLFSFLEWKAVKWNFIWISITWHTLCLGSIGHFSNLTQNFYSLLYFCVWRLSQILESFMSRFQDQIKLIMHDWDSLTFFFRHTFIQVTNLRATTIETKMKIGIILLDSWEIHPFFLLTISVCPIYALPINYQPTSTWTFRVIQNKLSIKE